MNTSNSTVKWRRCRCISVACSALPRALTQAQVRELFTKLGVVGALLDKVVKSISSSDDTLLTFMRKVGRWPASLCVLASCAAVECSGSRPSSLLAGGIRRGRGQRPQPRCNGAHILLVMFYCLKFASTCCQIQVLAVLAQVL